MRSCAKHVCNACPQRTRKLMEKTGQYSREDTRTPSDNYRVQKNTMKKVA